MTERRVRVKVCGVTRPEDARLAVELGADAVGIIMAERSPRCVARDTAMAVRAAVDGLTALVVLFADPAEAQVHDVVDWLRPDLIQFHGSESPDYCAAFGRPYIKALSYREADRWHAYGGARAIIIDSHAPGGAGGTGRSFDWKGFPSDSDRPLLLAGGLGPSNVAQAIALARPYGVDVSSGLERAPGIKDERKMQEFFSEVRRAERGQ
ncbi:MAG: phosphoribosylanthranilate isomerase [Xanthomonadales bacterium]|nr:phosphoribosylanthranilate isomerase [Xanthomonadales bacterium]